MADVRRVIRMTEAEVWRFIEERRNLQVASLNRDGSPHLTTLWFAVDDATVVFDTYAKAQKAVNLLRDPRVSVLLESGSTYRELCGVSIKGKAELVEDDETNIELKVRIGMRYSPDGREEDLRAQAIKSRAKRIVIRVVPEKIVSWDHRKLAT